MNPIASIVTCVLSFLIATTNTTPTAVIKHANVIEATSNSPGELTVYTSMSATYVDLDFDGESSIGTEGADLIMCCWFVDGELADAEDFSPTLRLEIGEDPIEVEFTVYANDADITPSEPAILTITVVRQ